MPESVTLSDATNRFVRQIENSRSRNTAKTYQNGMKAFLEMYKENENLEDSELDSVLVEVLNETIVSDFSTYLKSYSPTTETLYINVLKSFLEYLAAENMLSLNLNRVKMLIRHRTRNPGVRLSSVCPCRSSRKKIFARSLNTRSPSPLSYAKPRRID